MLASSLTYFFDGQERQVLNFFSWFISHWCTFFLWRLIGRDLQHMTNDFDLKILVVTFIWVPGNGVPLLPGFNFCSFWTAKLNAASVRPYACCKILMFVLRRSSFSTFFPASLLHTRYVLHWTDHNFGECDFCWGFVWLLAPDIRLAPVEH